MLTPEQEVEFERRFTILPLLAGSMAAGVLVCLALLALTAHAGPAAAISPGLRDAAPPALRYAFWLIAGLGWIAAAKIRDIALSGENLGKAAAAGASSLFSAIIVRHIILFAVFELIALLGLVLFVLSNRIVDTLPFAAASVLGFGWCWPRKQVWHERVETLLLR